LFDPPGTIGRKFAAFGRIETLDGFHQAYIALADEIEQGEPDALIVARDFYHQAQVGLIICSRAFLSPFLIRAARSISSWGVSNLTWPISRR